MSEVGPQSLHRREFLQAGAVASAAVVGLAAAESPVRAQENAAQGKAILPTRKLGQTGVEVTILNAGTWRAPDSLPMILRRTYSEGVRYYDTAHGYGTEPTFKKWFEAMPEVRKSIFLATKEPPHESPGAMLAKVDERCAALGVDHIDLLFYHGIGRKHIEWVKSKEMKEACEAIKKTGKVRFVGFSSHDQSRPEQLMAAAEGGFVDVIMLQFSPWIEKDSALNKALDACHKKGIGLVSMKQIAGNTLTETSQHIPDVLKKRKLNPAQGLLQAIWTDERFTCACVSMKNTDQVQENIHAARTFAPLTQAELDDLRDAYLAAGPTMCANCDGRCARAAGTTANLGDLARFYTYHEHHGHRSEARRYYAELAPEERDWHGADLEAARAACPNRLDFARLLPEADRLLS